MLAGGYSRNLEDSKKVEVLNLNDFNSSIWPNVEFPEVLETASGQLVRQNVMVICGESSNWAESINCYKLTSTLQGEGEVSLLATLKNVGTDHASLALLHEGTQNLHVLF